MLTLQDSSLDCYIAVRGLPEFTSLCITGKYIIIINCTEQNPILLFTNSALHHDNTEGKMIWCPS